jgi:hypothetical protein
MQVALIFFKNEHYTLFAMLKYTPTGIRSVDRPRKRSDKHSRRRNKPTLLLMIRVTIIQICLQKLVVIQEGHPQYTRFSGLWEAVHMTGTTLTVSLCLGS